MDFKEKVAKQVMHLLWYSDRSFLFKYNINNTSAALNFAKDIAYVSDLFFTDMPKNVRVFFLCEDGDIAINKKKVYRAKGLKIWRDGKVERVSDVTGQYWCYGINFLASSSQPLTLIELEAYRNLDKRLSLREIVERMLEEGDSIHHLRFLITKLMTTGQLIFYEDIDDLLEIGVEHKKENKSECTIKDLLERFSNSDDLITDLVKMLEEESIVPNINFSKDQVKAVVEFVFSYKDLNIKLMYQGDAFHFVTGKIDSVLTIEVTTKSLK